MGIAHVEAARSRARSYHARQAASAAGTAGGLAVARSLSGAGRDGRRLARTMVPMLAERADRARAAWSSSASTSLLLSVGPDLPYLTGYEAMPLERLTMLVLPRDGDATLVVPGWRRRGWSSGPKCSGCGRGRRPTTRSRIVAELVGAAGSWRSATTPGPGSCSTSRRRCPTAAVRHGEHGHSGRCAAVKDTAEIEALRRAAAAADRVAADLQAGEIPLVGRTEADVSADLGRRIVAEGHQHVNFAIVAAGANAASPHHDAGDRVIGAGDVVLCDFGGTMLDDDGVGYCSDITRCVHVGEPPAEVAEAYAVLHEAQQAAVAAAIVGTPCEEVDAAARRVITDAG